MLQSTIHQIVSDLQFQANCNLNIYLFGSHVYGTNDEESDVDFHVVLQQDAKIAELEKMIELADAFKIRYNAEIHLHTFHEWKRSLDNHEVYAVECQHLPPEFKWEDAFVPEFVLDKAKLRSAISEAVSGSWVKAKKKLTVTKDYDLRTAKKSMFHSYRILNMGIDLASGKEIQFSAMNSILRWLNNVEPNWEFWDTSLRTRHSELKTIFKQVCPK